METATVETFRSARYTSNLWKNKERREGAGACQDSSRKVTGTETSSSSETEEIYETRRGRQVKRINYKASKAKKKKKR